MKVSPLALALVTVCACSSSPPATQPSPASASAAASPSSAATAPTASASAGPHASPALALSPGLTEAMGRVKGLLTAPEDAAIQAAVSSTFLAHIPPEKVKEVFGHANAHLGACNDQQIVSVEGDTSAVVLLKCERSADKVSITINPAAPRLIEGLLMKPADQ